MVSSTTAQTQTHARQETPEEARQRRWWGRVWITFAVVWWVAAVAPTVIVVSQAGQ